LPLAWAWSCRHPVAAAAAAAALEANGVRSLITDSSTEARRLVGCLLPDGAEVFNNTSRTLEASGIAEDIEQSGRYQPLRPRLWADGPEDAAA
jgi:hypothetical protein